MKCQNCGNNNAVFHYQANINGRKIEQHLCADCAEKAGLSEDNFFGGDIFDTMLSNFFSGFSMPSRSFFPEFGRVMIPVMSFPRIEFAVKKDEADEEKVTADKTAVEKDEVMSRRREANLLREQLRAAVDSEEFEKAAELRDKIRELEVKE
jgi:protein arginine kinase activator